MIEQALFNHLTADTYVFSLIGDSTFLRLFPLVIPEKALKGEKRMPCAVYAVTSEQRQKTYCGTSGLVRVSVAIDSYALTLAAARELSTAIRGALIDYDGLMGAVVVRDITLEGSLTLEEIELGLMRVADTFTFWYEEES